MSVVNGVSFQLICRHYTASLFADNRTDNLNILLQNLSFSSDERIKKDITDDNMGLSFVNRLRPVTFKWKASQDVPESLTSQYDKDTNHKDTTSTFHGFIAQEVKAAMDAENIPASFLAWSERSDGTQGVSKGELIIPLINAVQELSAENKALSDRITTLENK